MALDLVNIGRSGIARSGLARLNAGEVKYSADPAAIALSGSAYVTVDPYVVVASGVVNVAGTSPTTVIFSVSNAGGAIIMGGASGVLADYSASASGTIDITGNTSPVPEYDIADAGGAALTDGLALLTLNYSPAASGEAVTSGTAPALLECLGTAGGSVAISGDVIPFADYIDVASGLGGAVMGGECVVIFAIDVKSLPVFIRKLDGDVRLSLSQDGGSIRIRAGQPEMDQGLETAVNISLFSQGDWWGNALARQGEDVGSSFLDALRQPLSNAARLDIIEAARSALAWFTESGIASAIEVSATIPAVGRLDLTLVIRQPERAPATFRYTVNWQSQRITMQEAA